MKHFDKVIKLFDLHKIINDSEISEIVRKKYNPSESYLITTN